MEVLDYNSNYDTFMSFKNKEETQELDSNTMLLLDQLFGFDRNKKNKKTKSGVSILKNHKIQSKKDLLVNKVNLILNKLSESNIEQLVIEFIENINQVDEDSFEEIQKAFYMKIISEINFIKIYLQFLKIISYLYNKVHNYDLSYFYSILEIKFKSDYLNYIITDPKFTFINEMDGEIKRINNLILIRHFIDNKFVSDKLITECDMILLNQTKYLPDIYYWFNVKNRELTNDITCKIKEILLGLTTILPREKVLLESLINKTLPPTTKTTTNVEVPKTVKKSNIESIDTIKLECNNIIEEYMLVKSVDDIKFFIEKRCTDALTKNKFCEQLIDMYFSMTKNTGDVIELIKVLIKSQTLFKSNLSRGLLLIYNNWKDRSIDYVKPNERMKALLCTLKNIGITKGLESMIETYQVD
jgi:hypothetical protein